MVYRNILICIFSVLPFWGRAQLSNPNQSKIDSLKEILFSEQYTDGSIEFQIANLQPRGEADTTLYYLNLALKKAKAAQNDEIVASAYVKKSWLFVTPFHQFDSTLHYVDLAFEYLDTLRLNNELSRAYNNKAIALIQLGELDEGLRFFKASAEIKKSMDDDCGYATALHNMAKVYKYLKMDSLANNYFHESLNLKEENRCTDNYSFIYFNIAAMHEANFEIDSTILYVRKTLRMDSLHGSTDHMAPANYLLGKMYNIKEEYDIAKIYLYKGKRVAEKTSNYSIQKYVYSELAKYYVGREQLDSSDFYVHKAKSFPKVSPDLNIVLDSLLYSSNLKRRNYKVALDYYKKFKFQSDSLQRSNLAVQLEAFQSQRKDDQIELLQKENELGALKSQKLKLTQFFLLAIFFMSMLFFINRIRNKNKKHQLELSLVESENKFEYQNLLNRLLRSQMNPHFIFNTLNSIKHYALFKNKEETGNYVTDFSLLVRGVLEYSDSDWIELQDDISWITNYIKIEKRRFNASFEFQLHIDSELSTEGESIPPLLIQPYVENAIWHGLLHKEVGVKKIVLRYTKIKNGFAVEIHDNGVGRDVSRKIKSKSLAKRKSLGMKITSDRIEQINKLGKSRINVEIVDLKSDNNIAEGTKVILQVTK